MIIELIKDEENKTILQILNYMYVNGLEFTYGKVPFEKFEIDHFQAEALYYRKNRDEAEYVWVFDIKEAKKNVEFFMFLHKLGRQYTDYIVVYDKYLRTKTLELQSVRQYVYRHNLSDYETKYNEVFSRYAKEIDTQIINQNKNNNNIINIQDCVSIRNLFLTNVRSKYSSDEFTSEMSGYYINPNMAFLFNGKKVTIDMFFELFGIDKDKLLDKIQWLKAKQLSIALIGLGGTMSNFCYFLNEIVNYFKIEDLFENLVIYENDMLEISNLPRIPLDYITPIRTRQELQDKIYKIDIFRNMRSLFKKNHLLNRMFNHRFTEPYDFVIGSPDIDTRVYLFENQFQNFICPLHYNNDLVIFENPRVVASDTSAETYGSIELTYFFLNMFRMTIELIDIMLKDKLALNKKVFEFNSKNSIGFFRENTKKSPNCYVLS